jgi:hypothetical protein
MVLAVTVDCGFHGHTETNRLETVKKPGVQILNQVVARRWIW